MIPVAFAARSTLLLRSSLTATLVLRSSSALAPNIMKPSPPLVHAPPRTTDFCLTEFGATVAAKDATTQETYEVSRQLQAALTKAKTSLNLNPDAPLQDVDDLFLSLIPAEAPRDRRPANLPNRLEEYVRYKAFAHFLQTGTLLPPPAYATDEEYLAGACMLQCHDIAHYALGRATTRDYASVNISRNLVAEIQTQLLEFDFRNGPLRRKFDSTKYALKTLETLLYELSVTGTTTGDEPEAKRLKEEELLPSDALNALRKRMEHRDELRENLIKKSRDGQKAAKQSIFALHRGDKAKSSKLLQDCKNCITQDLLPIVSEEPPLRAGSFANVLEEYAEAKLFYCWLYGKTGDGESPVGDILALEDFEVDLEPEEYLGGLCDLTGEIGRFAVQRGTARDSNSVKLALHSNSRILDEISGMIKTPSGINKKMDQLRKSVEKLERMLYEMSLSEATGRTVQTDANTFTAEAMETGAN